VTQVWTATADRAAFPTFAPFARSSTADAPALDVPLSETLHARTR